MNGRESEGTPSKDREVPGEVREVQCVRKRGAKFCQCVVDSVQDAAWAHDGCSAGWSAMSCRYIVCAMEVMGKREQEKG